MGRPRKRRLLGSRGALPSHINPSIGNAPRSVYYRWYNRKRWRRRVTHQLRQEPFCAYCAREGVYEVATIVDHVIPHRGNEHLFWFGTVQSLCKRCHDSVKKTEEFYGYRLDIGTDGLPIDKRHPFYRKRNSSRDSSQKKI